MNDVLSRIDHLIYGTPDLEATIETLESQLGIPASSGGQHLGEGTRNALYSLGPRIYLEILGPDPDQPKPEKPRWLGIDDLEEPRLVTWVARAKNLEQLVQVAAKNNILLGQVLAGSRQSPDGEVLAWQVTDPRTVVADGVVPFFIDWGETPHPSETAVQGLRLDSLRAEHPDPKRTLDDLKAVGLGLSVQQGQTPTLIATLGTPRGGFELK